MIALYIILGVIAVVAIWVIASYNGFVRAINRMKEAWSDIEVQMKRRYDLIPNLVNTVKGYAAHEAGTLEKVIQARNMAMGAQSMAQHAESENMITGALKSIFALQESYPDLKANANFAQLQSELADTENKIQAARRFYNTNVRDLNISVESFPSNIIAKMFKFAKAEMFDLDETPEARNVVDVKF